MHEMNEPEMPRLMKVSLFEIGFGSGMIGAALIFLVISILSDGI